MSNIIENEIQLTLPSNVSVELFPKNCVNSYKTKLAKTLELGADGSDWELAIMDIQYPTSIFNLEHDLEIAVVAQYPFMISMVGSSYWRNASFAASDQPEVNKRALEASDKYMKSHQIQFTTSSFALTVLHEYLKSKAQLEIPCFLHVVTIPKGYYTNVQEILNLISISFHTNVISFLEQELGAKNIALNFIYRTSSRKVSLTASGLGIHIYSSKSEFFTDILGVHLESILKFSSSEIIDDATLGSNLIPLPWHAFESRIALFEASGREENGSVDVDEAEEEEQHTPQLSCYFQTLPILSELPCKFLIINSIYIYCDLIKYQLVGNKEVQRSGLAPVQLAKDSPQVNYFSFTPPYYLPVNRSTIDEVEIQLNTENGDPFPFMSNSKIVIRLNLRRKPNRLGGGLLASSLL